MSKRTKIIIAVAAGVVLVMVFMRRRSVDLQVQQKTGATAATPRPQTALVALLADVGSLPGLALKGANDFVRKTLPPVGAGTVAVMPQSTPKPKAR